MWDSTKGGLTNLPATSISVGAVRSRRGAMAVMVEFAIAISQQPSSRVQLQRISVGVMGWAETSRVEITLRHRYFSCLNYQ